MTRNKNWVHIIQLVSPLNPLFDHLRLFPGWMTLWHLLKWRCLTTLKFEYAIVFKFRIVHRGSAYKKKNSPSRYHKNFSDQKYQTEKIKTNKMDSIDIQQLNNNNFTNTQYGKFQRISYIIYPRQIRLVNYLSRIGQTSDEFRLFLLQETYFQFQLVETQSISILTYNYMDNPTPTDKLTARPTSVAWVQVLVRA